MKSKHVRISVCSGDMVHADHACAVTMAMMRLKSATKVSLQSQRGSLIPESRHKTVVAALSDGVDVLIWVDSDVVVPPQTFERYANMCDNDHPVVGATYPQRVAPYQQTGLLAPARRLTSEDLDSCDGALLRVHALPAGCLAMHVQTCFSDEDYWYGNPYVSTWWSRHKSSGNMICQGEDYWLCERLREAGMRIWCDVETSKLIKHIGQVAVTYNMTTGGAQ